ncbi:unnamed protein product [marine sediment metagenome]|uniref:Uncharacterized protein n=1 Tax=marine sediment metagenome TaxID=412755 RepID=X1QJ64_9ZZZZ
MPRKRTKEEALERLMDVPDVPGLKGKVGHINRAARLGAMGLIMLDPFNRLADDFITIPIPMIAIPAHESHLLSGSPSMQIYIRAGETIVPTGGNVEDFDLGVQQAEAMQANAPLSAVAPVKKLTKYQKRYKREFAKLKPSYTLKNGKWKKNGFKACVKKAHANTKKALKLDGPPMTHNSKGKRTRGKY